MIRKLRHHEKKLLKKVDFYDWRVQSVDPKRESKAIHRYQLNSRDEFKRYNRLSHQINEIAHQLKKIPESDKFRKRATKTLMNRMYSLGFVTEGKSLLEIDPMEVNRLLNRRLCSVVTNSKMANNMEHAKAIIEQQHIRVGSTVISDPGFIVSKADEDMITWAHGSKYRSAAKEMRGEKDDFDEDLA